MGPEMMRRLLNSPFLLAVPAALIACLLAVINGYALLYQDSVAYIQRPAVMLEPFIGTIDFTPAQSVAEASQAAPSKVHDTRWMAGRSVWYGTLNTLLFAAGGVWLALFAHAWLATSVLAIGWKRGLQQGGITFLLLVAGLSAFSTLGVFSSLLMPDLLLAASMLSLATLFAFHPRLTRLETLFLALVPAYGALSHDSALPLIVGFAALILLWALCTRRLRDVKAGLWASLFALTVGIIGQIAFSTAAVRVTGETPSRLPFIAARLATTDIGRQHLLDSCPEAGWALCHYKAEAQKIGWVGFLFRKEQGVGVWGAATPEDRRRIEAEQGAFAISLAQAKPVAMGTLLVGDVFRQLVSVGLGDLDQKTTLDFLDTSRTAPLHDRLAPTRLVQPGNETLAAISVIATATGVLAAAGTILLLLSGAFRGRFGREYAFAFLLLLAFVVNAGICGILASPYDRFGARMLWLLPLACIFAAVAAGARGKRRTSVGDTEQAVLGAAE